VKTRIIVNGLEHIPIRDQVQVLCEQSVMCIDENMPRVAGWDLGEEIIRVANEYGRSVLGHLRMEKNLGSLRHARYSFNTEMSKCGNCPGIEISWNEIATSFS
jgi:hypothetical protein